MSEAKRSALWREYSIELTRYATLLVGPADAPDIVAAAFGRVTSSPREILDVRRYLLRAVTNAAADERRGQQRRRVRDLHAVIPISVPGTEPDLDVRRAVASLSMRQRAVVYFTYWDDLDSVEIGELLGISPASVRRHLVRARTHLRKALA